MKTLTSLFKGLISFIPYSEALFNTKSGKNVDASYYLQTFLSHAKIYENYKNNFYSFLEIGPGEVPGISIIAFALGINHIECIDSSKFASNESTKLMAVEIYNFVIENNSFPEKYYSKNIFPLLGFQELNVLYQKIRRSINLELLKKLIDFESPLDLLNYSHNGVNKLNLKNNKKFDFIFSQACLEHVDEVEDLINVLVSSLDNDGLMSHSIDLSSHGITNRIDGHFEINNLLWFLIRGRRKYFINRFNIDDYNSIFYKTGLKIVHSEYNSEAKNYYVSLSK